MNELGGIVVPLTIICVLIAGITVCVVAYFRLQAHRADAASLASYRRLAERVIEQQQRIEEGLRSQQQRLDDIDTLLRSVD